MEYLGLFDNSGNPLHKTIVRGNKDFKTGENIKLATIWIKCKDEFLVVKRSDNDLKYPGAWEFPGGHLEFGETLKEGLKREKEPLF